MIYNNEILVSASKDNTIKFWNLNNLKCIQTSTIHNGSVNKLIMIPKDLERKSNIFISISDDGTAKMWNNTEVINDDILKELALKNEKLLSANYNKRFFYLSIGTDKGNIYNFKLDDYVKTLSGHIKRISKLLILSNKN